MDLGAFGLQADVTLLDRCLADAVDEFAVHGQLDDTVYTNDNVCVPLALSFAAVLDGLASAAARIVRDRIQTTRTKDFTVHVGDWREGAVLFFV